MSTVSLSLHRVWPFSFRGASTPSLSPLACSSALHRRSGLTLSGWCSCVRAPFTCGPIVKTCRPCPLTEPERNMGQHMNETPETNTHWLLSSLPAFLSSLFAWARRQPEEQNPIIRGSLKSQSARNWEGSRLNIFLHHLHFLMFGSSPTEGWPWVDVSAVDPALFPVPNRSC